MLIYYYISFWEITWERRDFLDFYLTNTNDCLFYVRVFWNKSNITIYIYIYYIDVDGINENVSREWLEINAKRQLRALKRVDLVDVRKQKRNKEQVQTQIVKKL